MTINGSSLVAISARLQKSSHRIHKYWETLPIDILERKGSFHATYAIFNSCFCYDLPKGRNHLNAYKRLMKNNIENYKSNIIDNKNLHDNHNMSFLIRGDLSSLGEIVDCSSNVKTNLGYTKSGLIGKNINLILSPFFQSIQLDLMKKKLASDEELYHLDHINAFAKDQNGLIIPVRNVLTIYPSFKRGLLFLSLMRRLDSEDDYMLVGENGIIEGVSPKLRDELGLNPSEKIHVSSLSPSLGKLEKLLGAFSMEKLDSKAEDKEETNSANAADLKQATNQTYLGSYIEGDTLKVPTSSNKVVSKADETECIEIAQDILSKGKTFSFKSCKPGMKNIRINYFCKCILHIHQGTMLKVYVMQKTNVHIALSSRHSSQKHQGSEKKASSFVKRNSDDFDHSLKEFDERSGKESNIHLPEGSTYLTAHKVMTGGNISNQNLKAKVIPILRPPTNSSSENEVGTETFKYQSSVKSDVSDYRKRVEKLDVLVTGLKFYRFSELKIPFGFILIYLIILLITVWLLYVGAVNSIPQIKGTVEVFSIMLRRSNQIYTLMRNFGLVAVSPILKFDPTGSSLGMANNLINLGELNTDLNEKLHNLQPETKELFYEENIKIYYDGFDDIKTSNFFNLQNSMTSLNSIISQGLYYVSQTSDPARVNNTRYNYVEKYLYSNIYNDYLLKNEELQKSISADLEAKTDDIELKNGIFISITSTVFTITVVAIAVIVYWVYTRVCEFLEDFVNGGYDTELSQLRSTVNQFRTLLDSDMDLAQNRETYQRSYSVKNLAKPQKKAHNFGRNRKIQGVTIFIQYFTTCAFTVILLACGLAITVLASIKYTDRTQAILPVMNDITQAAEISIHAQAVMSILTLYINKPDKHYKYEQSGVMFNSYIEKMRHMVSQDKTNFSPEFQIKMNTDLCLYVNLTLNPTCPTVLQGIAKKGIIPVIYSIENIVMSFKNSFDAAPDTPTKSYTFPTPQDMREANPFVTEALAPAVSKIIQERSDDLADMLDETSKIVIKYAIFGNIVAGAILIYVFLYLYKALMEQRKTMTKIMSFLPPTLIAKNRYIREFLLRQDKRFFSYVKTILEQDYTYSLDDFLGKKKTHISVIIRQESCI